jgi:hypothetical protein
MPDENDFELSKNSLAREFFDCGYDQCTASQKVLIDSRFDQLSRLSRPTVFTCTECDSVHFNVARPLPFSDIWKVCCEGCGAIYDLLPSGDVQLHSR